MNAERYRQVKLILHAALEVDPASRAAFLEKSCAGDSELRAEAESLLRHDGQSAGFLEKPAPEALQTAFRLKPGARLGPYEIVRHIGSGGMGEVYQAHDPRFGRDVALKLLPPAFVKDPDRLQRFEREARAAGSLNHPNILAVYDFGNENGMPYLVSELLRGETLRQRVGRSGIAPSTALEWAAQIARGLGAAHTERIVHRDLKPENIFVVKGGVVKILDFGLAQLPPVSAAGGAPSGTATPPGMVLGTMGYASPEQVRGEPTDHRSDIFSLGVILHEMLTGRRPFAADTWVEEANNIVRQDPPELPSGLPGISSPALLRRILRQCLAKQPDERFDSARDLAVLLESAAEYPSSKPQGSRFRGVLWIGAAVVVAVAAGFVARSGVLRAPPPYEFQRLTFRRGVVSAARFTADGNTIVYSAAWDQDDFSLFSTRLDRPESRPLGHPAAMLFSVSSQGDLALCIPTGRTQHGVSGKLARVALAGGGALERAENVSAADWSPDGSKLAVVRSDNGRSQIEYPIDRVVYRYQMAAAYMDAIRVSPRGDAVAFIDHPLQEDSAGRVAVVDLATRNYRALSSRFNSMRGLAWSPDGGEIWFAAAKRGTRLDVWAVNLSGRERVVARFPAYISLEDISRDRRALISLHTLSESMVHVPAAGEPRDLYWHDQSQVRDISRDSRSILFAESGDATGQDYDAYLRAADGSSPAVYLGVGLPLSLSPDGRWAIANPAGAPARLTLLPTGPGEPRPLADDHLNHLGAAWLPDGKSFVFAGLPHGGKVSYYLQPTEGGPPRPITTEEIHYDRRSPIVVSPDGRAVAAVNADKHVAIYPTTSGPPQRIPGLDSGFTPLQWCPDGRLVLHRYDEPSAQLWKVDVQSGRLGLWKKITPPNPVGLLDLTPIRVSPDCQSYAYSPLNVLSHLYLASGLR